MHTDHAHALIPVPTVTLRTGTAGFAGAGSLRIARLASYSAHEAVGVSPSADTPPSRICAWSGMGEAGTALSMRSGGSTKATPLQ